MLLHKHAQHGFFSFRKWRPWWQRQQGVQVERNAHKIANARRPPRSVNEAYAVLATEGARKLHLLIDESASIAITGPATGRACRRVLITRPSCG